MLVEDDSVYKSMIWRSNLLGCMENGGEYLEETL